MKYDSYAMSMFASVVHQQLHPNSEASYKEQPMIHSKNMLRPNATSIHPFFTCQAQSEDQSRRPVLSQWSSPPNGR